MNFISFNLQILDGFKKLNKLSTERNLLLSVIVRIILFSLTFNSCKWFVAALHHAAAYSIMEF